jgi:hypothetical protein
MKPPGSLAGMAVPLLVESEALALVPERGVRYGSLEEEERVAITEVSEIVDEVRDAGDAGLEKTIDVVPEPARAVSEAPVSRDGMPASLEYSDGIIEEDGKAAVSEVIDEAQGRVADGGPAERSSANLPFADDDKTVRGPGVDRKAETVKEEPPDLTVEMVFDAVEEIARRDPLKAAELRHRIPELVERLLRVDGRNG